MSATLNSANETGEEYRNWIPDSRDGVKKTLRQTNKTPPPLLCVLEMGGG